MNKNSILDFFLEVSTKKNINDLQNEVKTIQNTGLRYL
jgi:hypothetical protein